MVFHQKQVKVYHQSIRQFLISRRDLAIVAKLLLYFQHLYAELQMEQQSKGQRE